MEAESNTDSDSKPIFSTNAQGAVFGAIWIKKKINNDLFFFFFFCEGNIKMQSLVICFSFS